MTGRFEAEKLHSELDVLVNYTDIERDLDTRFRQSYSPFTPTINRPMPPEPADYSSPMSATSYMLKAHVPTAAPEEEAHAQDTAAQYSSEEDASLKECVLKGIGAIGKKEQVSRWQGSVDVATEKACDDEAEITTEKATSYSGSEDGDCIQPTGEIEIHHAPAAEPLGDSSVGAGGGLAEGKKPALFKRERRISSESSDGFVFKRRRSARIAALVDKPE
ncbi:hypothetical protein BDV28DRAFT_145115 [Aspergillus coremiiformis]|uniref:Uncharacterized protein n=1 Tax=Aspergillus coremiiformis TaxID=138285 RepID=A0A5N6ZFF9_9EURO|nr:hypothetical protein BDV28DRAFT_145115 [Aspergillus coremiiformis]